MPITPLEGFYINLESRIDRKQYFEENIKNHDIFANIQRMDATYSQIPGLGCTLSHIRCLKEIRIRQSKEKNVLPTHYVIMEDDFSILNMNNFNEFIKDFELLREDPHWDVILLTPRGVKVVENESNVMTLNHFSRIIESQTATGYIFKEHMIDILLDNFTNVSYENIIKGQEYIFGALDQTWKPLQKVYKFYYYDKIYGGQLPGWSDLENQHVNYNYGFLIQGQDFVNEDDVEHLVK